MVESVDFRVVATLPLGVTVVPLLKLWVLPVVTPSLVVVCSELLWLTASGVTTGAVVCVVVELEDDISAWAAPVIIARVIAAAR